MTTEQTALQRLKDVCEASTPGPWEQAINDWSLIMGPNGKLIGDCLAEVYPSRHVTQETAVANSTFLAVARTALPALIDLCEAQDRLIAAKASAQLKDALGRACLDQRYLDAVADLHAATNAVEDSRARLEDVCPK